MDSFSAIIEQAKRNQGCKDREIILKKTASTSVKKPKRESKDKAKGVNSAAVQAFLKKLEEEEKLKALEAQKKKEKLMKLRVEKNSIGKMNNMIKRCRTKETIFQVEGNDKKAEDVSSAKAEKTEVITEYTKLKSQCGGKERVAAIKHIQRKPVSANWVPKEEREKEEKLKSEKEAVKNGTKKSNTDSLSLPSQNPLTSKGDKIENSLKQALNRYQKEKHADHKNNQKEVEEVKKKKKPPGPPPMKFDDLMKLAQGNKKTCSLDPSGQNSKKKKAPDDPKMPDRPMTQEEKERWKRVHTKEYQDWIKHGKARPDFCVKNVKSSTSSSSSQNAAKMSLVSDKVTADRNTSHSKDGQSSSMSKLNMKADLYNSHSKTGQSSSMSKLNLKGDLNSNPKAGQSSSMAKLKLKAGRHLLTNDDYSSTPSKNKMSSSDKVKSKDSKISQSVSSKAKKSSSQKGLVSGSSNMKKLNAEPSYDEVRSNIIVCSDEPAPTKNNQKAPHMSTWDRIYAENNKKKLSKSAPGGSSRKRNIVESDSEQDSDLDGFIEDDEDEDEYDDDFIDDSEVPGDISSMIGQIFKYDKSKYKDEDDDLSDMEAGYDDIEREEKISARLGMIEDEREFQREQEHKKRKMLMKKQLAKKMRLK